MKQMMEKINEAESYSKGKFQGMVIEALADIRCDIREIKQGINIRGYINYGISGIIALITSLFMNNKR